MYQAHACVHFFSSMLLASVHRLDFMAHDVSASRNLESELPLGISPQSLFGAFDRFHRQHRVHRAGVLIAFCTKNCCSPMLIVKVSSHCLHRDVAHHLRKLNVRFHSPKSRTLTYSCPPCAPPRAPTSILVDLSRCAMRIVVFEHIV